MKRFTPLVLMALAAAVSIAQSPFTIVRPADGSKVREVVKFQVPRSSVPSAGYIGVFVNGRFVEAVLPTEHSTYFEYGLDTKKLQLPDGPTKVELALFVDYNDQPRIVDRSYVTVNIANKANIPIPTSGLQLRYRLNEGVHAEYDVEVRLAKESLTSAEAAKSGKPGSLPIDPEKYTAEYVVVNSFANGDSLLFMRGLPPAGKKKTFLQLTSNPDGQWVDEKEFSQSYMRVTATGSEVYGTIPRAFSADGINLGDASLNNVYIFDPLPTLPVRRVKPGDSWQARFVVDAIDLSRAQDLTKLTEPIPARGELVGVEWEMGRPCAKIRHTLELGGPSIKRGSLAGRTLKMEEQIWFALDRGLVQKMIRTFSVDLAGSSAAYPSPGAPATNPGPPNTPGAYTPYNPNGPGGFGRGGNQGGGGQDDGMSRQEGGGKGRRGGGGLPPSGPPPQGFPGIPSAGGPVAPATPPATGFERIVVQQIFTLRG